MPAGARSPQAKRPRTRGTIAAASQVAMTLWDFTAGYYKLGGRLEREESFIGGIHEAVDTHVQILTNVTTRLMAVEQVSAASVLKTEQMERYLASSHQEIADSLEKINANDVAQDNKLRSDLNILSSRLHEAHGELEGKLAALSVLIGGGEGHGPPGLAGMTETLEKL